MTSALVETGDQFVVAKSEQASTTIDVLVLHENVKPKWLDFTPKFVPPVRITGDGCQREAGIPPNVELHPKVPGR